jgi:hypothetical protein
MGSTSVTAQGALATGNFNDAGKRRRHALHYKSSERQSISDPMVIK